MKLRSFSKGLFLTAIVSLALTGCSAAQADNADTQTPPEEISGYPLAIDNCGFDVTITEAPNRVVAIKSAAVDVMLELGLEEKIVGLAFLDGPLSAEHGGLPVISEKAPSTEAVLELEPDFILAGWESNLTPDTAGDRSQLAKMGINSYVLPAACKAPGYQPEQLTFENVFAQIEEVGKIFGVEESASELIAKQRGELDEVWQTDPGTTALWYSSGPVDLPYVGAGIGAPNMIIEALGMDNVLSDVNDTWTSVSWEVVADKNPDVLILVDALWDTVEEKISLLKSNPVTAQMDAVKNDRFIVIDFAASEAGVRTAPATVDLGKQLSAMLD